MKRNKFVFIGLVIISIFSIALVGFLAWTITKSKDIAPEDTSAKTVRCGAGMCGEGYVCVSDQTTDVIRDDGENPGELRQMCCPVSPNTGECIDPIIRVIPNPSIQVNATCGTTKLNGMKFELLGLIESNDTVTRVDIIEGNTNSDPVEFTINPDASSYHVIIGDSIETLRNQFNMPNMNYVGDPSISQFPISKLYDINSKTLNLEFEGCPISNNVTVIARCDSNNINIPFTVLRLPTENNTSELAGPQVLITGNTTQTISIDHINDYYVAIDADFINLKKQYPNAVFPETRKIIEIKTDEISYEITNCVSPTTASPTADPTTTGGTSPTVDPSTTQGTSPTADPTSTGGTSPTVDPSTTQGTSPTTDPTSTNGASPTNDSGSTSGSPTNSQSGNENSNNGGNGNNSNSSGRGKDGFTPSNTVLPNTSESRDLTSITIIGLLFIIFGLTFLAFQSPNLQKILNKKKK